MDSRYITPLLVSAMTAILIFFFLLLSIPSATPYSIINDGFSGLSRLYTEYRPRIILEYSELAIVNASDAVFIVAREKPLLEAEIDRLRLFLESGGLAIVFGSRDFLNSLLTGLGIEDRVGKAPVYDAVFNAGDRSLVATSNSICSAGVVVYRPMEPVLRKGTPVVFTSNYSYVDLNGNGYWDLDEPLRSTSIGLLYRVGHGELYIFTTEALLTNSVVEYNRLFLSCIAGDREVLLDQSFIYGYTLEYLKVLKVVGRLTPYIALLIAVLSLLVIYVVEKVGR